MASNFAKLDKSEGVDFRRWQKKMHFMLSSMSVVYVLTTPILEDDENATVDQIRRRAIVGHVHFKRMQDMSKDGLIPTFDMDTEKCNNKGTIDNIISQLQSAFALKDLGPLNYFLGIEIVPYALDDNIDFFNPVKYRQVVGSLQYVTLSRPDIAFAVNKIDLKKEFLSPRFLMKDMRESDVILGIRIKHESNMIAIPQSHYIEKDTLMQARSAILKTSSTMESECVALTAAGKEAEWLKNLILEILLWFKPIAPISILFDSATTLPKAYSQMYNRKSRHLGVRHNMIRELIINGVVSIKFVRFQQNLANHLTKGLTKDLVLKSAEGRV
nr:zinc finger, CCHC-type [Tanacetum cinerariifolium]